MSIWAYEETSIFAVPNHQPPRVYKPKLKSFKTLRWETQREKEQIKRKPYVFL